MTASLKLSRPLHLLLAALTYVLGVSIAGYLGKPFHLDLFWLGFAGVDPRASQHEFACRSLSPGNEPIIPDETRSRRKSIRDAALYVSVAALAANAVIAFTLYLHNRLHLSSFVFLLLSLLIVLAYSVPAI